MTKGVCQQQNNMHGIKVVVTFQILMQDACMQMAKKVSKIFSVCRIRNLSGVEVQDIRIVPQFKIITPLF